jgi:hypothetical protein
MVLAFHLGPAEYLSRLICESEECTSKSLRNSVELLGTKQQHISKDLSYLTRQETLSYPYYRRLQSVSIINNCPSLLYGKVAGFKGLKRLNKGRLAESIYLMKIVASDNEITRGGKDNNHND